MWWKYSEINNREFGIAWRQKAAVYNKRSKEEKKTKEIRKITGGQEGTETEHEATAATPRQEAAMRPLAALLLFLSLSLLSPCPSPIPTPPSLSYTSAYIVFLLYSYFFFAFSFSPLYLTETSSPLALLDREQSRSRRMGTCLALVLAKEGDSSSILG